MKLLSMKLLSQPCLKLTVQFFNPAILSTLAMIMLQPSIILAQTSYSIAIHGGAGEMPAFDSRAGRLSELNRVLNRGIQMLQDGKSSLDVVEAVIQQLEDCEWFNAGRGCVLNDRGEHELDASIMDGRTLACGAVAGVKTTRYPISLARLVMTSTQHVLLSGTGADELGRLMNLPQADAEHFVTEKQRQRYLRWKKAASVRGMRPANTLAARPDAREHGEDAYYGTVGCVVMDRSGNLAAGTSTGGLLGKRWGRIGDSPIIGAGNYADNATCAVSGTGIGEEFIRFSVASDIAARMRYAGNDSETACKETMARLPAECGGVICVDRHGQVTALHNTKAMSYALADSKGRRVVQLCPNAATEPEQVGSD